MQGMNTAEVHSIVDKLNISYQQLDSITNDIKNLIENIQLNIQGDISKIISDNIMPSIDNMNVVNKNINTIREVLEASYISYEESDRKLSNQLSSTNK